MGEKLDFRQPKKTLARHLSEFLSVYGRAGTDVHIEAYSIALDGLSAENLAIAFEATYKRHRSSFPPTPGEILAYLDAALNNSPMKGSSARPDCPKCDGTGFVIEDIPGQTYAGGTPYRQARRCSCLPPK
jgi:hypothetical protein